MDGAIRTRLCISSVFDGKSHARPSPKEFLKTRIASSLARCISCCLVLSFVSEASLRPSGPFFHDIEFLFKNNYSPTLPYFFKKIQKMIIILLEKSSIPREPLLALKKVNLFLININMLYVKS